MKKKANKKPVKKPNKNDITLKLDMTFEEAIKKLGTPNKKKTK